MLNLSAIYQTAQLTNAIEPTGKLAPEGLFMEIIEPIFILGLVAATAWSVVLLIRDLKKKEDDKKEQE